MSSKGRNPAPASRLFVEPVDELEPLREDWSALGERSGNLFATWEWNRTWWEHMSRGRPLMTAACRDQRGALIGLLPAYLAREAGPLRVMRMLGHGQGDRLGPISMPSDRPRVAAALRGALRSRPWANALVLAEHLPAEEDWSRLLHGRFAGWEASPLVELTTRDWDEFLAGRSTSLRKQVRYQERRLFREHDACYRLVDDADALPGALDALFALHATRWGEAAAEAYGGVQGFHRAFAAQAHERGWLRLWLLEVDGRPVAAWHGFRFAGADWHYQSGRDPAWDHYSVGAVLLAHTIRDCVEAGLARYLFLRGAEPYKRRFATADPGLETFVIGAGALGRPAAVAAGGLRRLPPAGRRRIARALGGS